MKELISVTLNRNQWELVASYLTEQIILLSGSNSPHTWIVNLREVIDEINEKLNKQ
jgi:hypothetical protein